MTKGGSESKRLGPLLQNLTKDSKEKCPVARLAKTDPDSADILDDLLMSESISVRKIHRVIRAENMGIGREALQAHRDRKCSCFNAA